MIEIGVDCEEISRFRRIPFKKRAEFYRRVFTPAEISYCTSFRDPYPHFAARFAAKEAVIKALSGITSFALVHIEIRNRKNGSPVVAIAPGRLKIRRPYIRLSLSHSRSHAIAFVLVTDARDCARALKRSLPAGG